MHTNLERNGSSFTKVLTVHTLQFTDNCGHSDQLEDSMLQISNSVHSGTATSPEKCVERLSDYSAVVMCYTNVYKSFTLYSESTSLFCGYHLSSIMYNILQNPRMCLWDRHVQPVALKVQQQYSPTGDGVLPLLEGCWIWILCGDGGGSCGRELMIDGNRKGYTLGV